MKKVIKTVMRPLLALTILFLLSGWLSTLPITVISYRIKPDIGLLQVSESFLSSVRSGKSNEQVAALRNISTDSLIRGLTDDRAKMVFWINLYNGWFQILAQNRNGKEPDIFSLKQISFSDHSFSLDDIEHGILRKYRWKYSMGYLPAFFPSTAIKQLAVNNLDYRIHFALNCGAKSCPPIIFYLYDHLEEQLNLAKQNFIESESIIDGNSQVVKVSKIFYWFKADFGGTKGIMEMISNTLNKNLKGYTLAFSEYDWTTALHNYK
jgi:hypothetical protein